MKEKEDAISLARLHWLGPHDLTHRGSLLLPLIEHGQNRLEPLLDAEHSL